MQKSKDSIPMLRSALASLKRKIERNEIIVKATDKGPIIVLMSLEFYWDVCNKHLHSLVFHGKTSEDPSDLVWDKAHELANKFHNRLTDNEFIQLTTSSYTLLNLYMLPKLHKSKEINTAIRIE